jgi:hypothetical protein
VCQDIVAAVERLHVLDGEARVVEGHQRRFGAKASNGPVGEPAELDHVRSDHKDVRHG